jgi:fluoride exporter
MPPPDAREHHDPFPDLPVDPDATREADVPPPRIHTAAVAVVASGGALGALGRWTVAEALPHGPSGFPWATLLANVTGCFLIGGLMVLVIERWPERRLVRPFWGTGVLGGFTTFSTYAVDTRALVAADHVGAAVGYVVGTLLVGLVAVVAGMRLAERLTR